MNKTITLDGREYQIDAELLAKLINKEEIKSDVMEEVKLSGWERVERAYSYYYINEYFEVETDIEEDYTLDIERNENINNYFSTESKAQEMADKIKLLLAMAKLRDENDRDYDGATRGYTILIDEDLVEDIYIDYISVSSVFDILFSTRELAEQCLEVFRDDIKKIWGIE